MSNYNAPSGGPAPHNDDGGRQDHTPTQPYAPYRPGWNSTSTSASPANGDEQSGYTNSGYAPPGHHSAATQPDHSAPQYAGRYSAYAGAGGDGGYAVADPASSGYATTTPAPPRKVYGAALPALLAALVAAAIPLAITLLTRGHHVPSGDATIERVWERALPYDLITYATGGEAKDPKLWGGSALLFVLIAGPLFAALAGAKHSAARVLTFLGAWGAVVLASALTAAAVGVLGKSGSGEFSGSAFRRAQACLDIGATSGFWYGVLPALLAALTRIGRTRSTSA